MGAASSAHAERVERIREAVAHAEGNFAKAKAHVEASKGALVEIHRASQRKASIIAVADWRHGVQWRRELSLVRRYGPEIAKAILWELSKDAAGAVQPHNPSTAKVARLVEATRTLRDIIPSLSTAEATSICRRAQGARGAINRDVGAAIGFTWDEYLALRNSGLGEKARQIWPADISADEFIARRGVLRRAEDAARKARARKERGCLTAEERAANEAAKREWVDEQALLHGKSPRTIRSWLTAGKLAYPEHLQSAVQGIDYE